MKKAVTAPTKSERAKPRQNAASEVESELFSGGPAFAHVDAVMQAAERSGLFNEKSSRIGGRVSPALINQAKRRTGIESDSELIAFALASVALEDHFAAAFRDSRETVDADLILGF